MGMEHKSETGVLAFDSTCFFVKLYMTLIKRDFNCKLQCIGIKYFDCLLCRMIVEKPFLSVRHCIYLLKTASCVAVRMVQSLSYQRLRRLSLSCFNWQAQVVYSIVQHTISLV